MRPPRTNTSWPSQQPLWTIRDDALDFSSGHLAPLSARNVCVPRGTVDLDIQNGRWEEIQGVFGGRHVSLMLLRLCVLCMPALGGARYASQVCIGYGDMDKQEDPRLGVRLNTAHSRAPDVHMPLDYIVGIKVVSISMCNGGKCKPAPPFVHYASTQEPMYQCRQRIPCMRHVRFYV